MVVLTGVWIALAGRLDAQDLVGGFCAAGLAAVTGFLVSQQGRALPALRRADARLIATLPGQVVAETARVFVLAARKAAGRTEAGGSWAHLPVDVGGGGWRSAGRDSVLTALLSVAPGAIVVDIDADSGWPWCIVSAPRAAGRPAGEVVPGWRAGAAGSAGSVRMGVLAG